MTITKKQHYIPQGLIKHFSCGDNKIFELFNNRILSKKSIRDTMSQNLVYEHEKLPTNTIEHFFSKIEGSFIPQHDELVLKIEKSYLNKQEIPKVEINKLLQFYVFLYLRSGALLEEYSAYSEDPKNQRVEEMLKNLFSSSYPAKLANTILQGYQISIIVNEQETFVMSDQFISTASLKFKNKFTNASNRQIGFKDSIIFIPLTSKFYIVFYNGNEPEYIIHDQYSVLNTIQIKKVNNVLAENSYNKTICSQSEPLEKIKLERKAAEADSPVKSIAVYKNGDVSISTIKKEIEFYDSEFIFSQNYISLFNEYKNDYEGKVKRNDICLCGSKKKYKKCCLTLHERCLTINRQIQNKKRDWYSIDSKLQVEKAIVIYKGPKENISNLRDQNILNQLGKHKFK